MPPRTPERSLAGIARSAAVFEPGGERLALRSAAERLLGSPDFRNIKVTELAGIEGARYDVTVTLGKLPSLGGWRIAPVRHLTDTLTAATKADSSFTSGITTRQDIPNTEAAKAGVIEAERLATDMALKWAIMRATIKNAKRIKNTEGLADIYSSRVTDAMIDSWIEASQFSGGKSVTVNENPNEGKIVEDDRRLLMMQHGAHINAFNHDMGDGNTHYTAPDMGITTADIAALQFFTPAVASAPPEYGGSGDPSPVTALGVYHGINATLDFLDKDGDQMTFAVQGAAGEVGSRLIRHLRERYREAKIVITDLPSKDADLDRLVRECNATKVKPEEIFEQEGSIVIPSGPSAQLDDNNLAKMKDAHVLAVVGPANYLYPPYREEEMSQKFHDENILVAPAPLVNQGGIRNIALGEFTPEAMRPSQDIVNESVADIGPMLKQVYKQAQDEGKTPEAVFREIALDEFAALCVASGILDPNHLN